MTPGELKQWGEHAAGSPLYRHLIGLVASDHDLMRVLNEIEHTPRPNMLFAGVQYLLMRDPEELADFYPNLTDEPSPTGDVDRLFRDYVLEHEAELVEIGRTRHTQTNEIRRCTALLAAIWETSATRFHLVDLGTSAGLTLLIDRYRYRWDGVEWGPSSPVVLESELRGRAPDPRPVDVLARIGLDLNPLDPGDPDDRMWLEALIWPEQFDRRDRLRAAIELQETVEVDLVAGDATETLAPTLRGLRGSDPVVIMHSFALNQLGPHQRGVIDETIGAVRADRTVWKVSMELLDWAEDAPALGIDDGSGPVVVGRAQPHGEWLELYARP